LPFFNGSQKRFRASIKLNSFLISLKDLKLAILIDVNVVENENCYPMVAPGRSNSQMLGLESS
jgi:hypothetical protein